MEDESMSESIAKAMAAIPRLIAEGDPDVLAGRFVRRGALRPGDIYEERRRRALGWCDDWVQNGRPHERD